MVVRFKDKNRPQTKVGSLFLKKPIVMDPKQKKELGNGGGVGYLIWFLSMNIDGWNMIKRRKQIYFKLQFGINFAESRANDYKDLANEILGLWNWGMFSNLVHISMNGAMTFNITTLSIMAFSLMTFSLKTLGIMILYAYAECLLCWVLKISLLCWTSLC